ncbi:hypothetical protein CEUSTIGMA_g3891.t1 [Chlamydomonas eustigma]|uniref:Uncharacterized protein n=1 Tax=Chlamydomonas eustigma TaxID=1157962 RepID=A0A250X064_9CHLO|nr:hypothetical protein CEUSTIGMA_g3891.t1 [Chlamydomonas eustigma]|eukprot:GAX76446.1 hypothetical protein CEUSTIGMA_g3891.t1 [Chlamydomonas eustigma]
MRVNYEQGVDQYYLTTGSDYRNPHLPGILKAVSSILELWWPLYLKTLQPQGIRQTSNHVRSMRSSVGHPGTTLADTPATNQCSPAAAGQPHNSLLSNLEGDMVVDHEAEGTKATLTELGLPLRKDIFSAPAPVSVNVLDLAAGSGEATQAVQSWWSRRFQQKNKGGISHGSCRHMNRPSINNVVRIQTTDHGLQAIVTQQLNSEGIVSNTTTQEKEKYSPPGAGDAVDPILSSESLALPAGGNNETEVGSVSKVFAVESSGTPPFRLNMSACDPYTYQAYEQWVGRPAERFSFQDIADGCLLDRFYHLCICSYALHVLEESKLFSTLIQLSFTVAHLVVVSPHKKPLIGAHTGWLLLHEMVIERVHVWLYESLNNLSPASVQECQSY